jgi:glycosyltransferase involved in cell wall biosynthesis
MHITSLGHFRAINKLNYPFYLKIYYFISSLIESFCLKQIYNNTKFVVDSPLVGTELSEATGHDINFKYIPNGVATTKFKPLENKKSLKRELQIPTDKMVFLAVGRLSYPKKLFTMVTVFDKLQKKVNNCVLIICGNGELEDQLKDYVRVKDIKNIEFRGFIPHDELPFWYGCADYYITTSGYEGQPLTLLEAMACGLPCIVSNIPNMQIVDHAQCGIVVDFSDKEHAAKKIISYIMQDNSKHSINARKYAVENLDWNIIANRYLEEFYIQT